MQVDTFANSAVSAIDREIQSIVSNEIGTSSQVLYEIIQDHFGWNRNNQSNGKKLRPLICLLAAQSKGADWRSALPAAAAIEMIHNYSLIHDDIEDQDRIRHNRPTAWVRFGVPQAINAGDALLAAGINATMRLGKSFSDYQKVLVARKITTAVVRLTKGQSRDLSYASKPLISLEEYEEMIADKTSALIESAISIGATLAGFSSPEIKRFESYGHAVGMAFQIQDDFLGIWGDPGKTGKSASNDLLSAKKSLPVVIGLNLNKEFSRFWATKSISQQTLKEAISLLDEDGVKEIVNKMQTSWWEKALGELKSINGKFPQVSQLVDFVDMLKKREN